MAILAALQQREPEAIGMPKMQQLVHLALVGGILVIQ